MCCNKRRQNAYGNYANYGRYGSCGSRSRSNAASNIGAVIGAFQQIRLDSRQPQQLLPQTSQIPRELNGQTQGVVYPSVLDEKSAPQQVVTVNEEQLPSYEESTKPLNRSVSAPATRPETQATPIFAIQQQESSNRVVALGLQHFNAGLEAYRLGDKKSAKKAARSFIRDLYDQEMERRRSDKGYLECGERKEIKRELRPLKQMMKEAVREAKVERRMQRV